jgi:DNA-binding response OmpR family regulator
MKILVAEDDTDIATIIKTVLLKESFLVDIARNGKEAYSLLNEEEYDLLLLDLMMPFISGEELLSQLQKENINIPTIVLTAKDSTNKRVELLNNGADDFLPAPTNRSARPWTAAFPPSTWCPARPQAAGSRVRSLRHAVCAVALSATKPAR